MTSHAFRYDLLTIVLLFLILATVFIVYFPLAATIILGLTLALVLQPICRRLAGRMPPSRAAALTSIVVLAAIGLGIYLVVDLLIQGSGMFFSMIATINQWLGSIRPDSLVSGVQAENFINSVLTFLKAQIVPILASVPLMLFHALILLLAVYLFLLKGPDLSSQIRNAIPDQLNDSFGKISGLVVNTLHAIYIVSVEVAILAFVLSLLIYYLLGYPAVVVLALLSGVAMFVPIFGPLVVMVFLILYNLATGNLPGVLIALFIIYPIVFWIPGNYIRSKLMGKRVSIHPVLMMIGIIGGINIMGLYGLILGPLFIALLVSSYHILIDQLVLVKGRAGEPAPQ